MSAQNRFVSESGANATLHPNVDRERPPRSRVDVLAGLTEEYVLAFRRSRAFLRKPLANDAGNARPLPPVTTPEEVERRLVAVLIADVVGYGRLLAERELETVERLWTLRRLVVEPLAQSSGACLIRTAGDSVMVMFASAVRAVECAAAIRAVLFRLGDRSEGTPLLWLRMGISLDDAIIEDDDVHGAGVNLAARLEAAAAPGEILVSRAVKEQVVGRTATPLHAAGRRRLKGMAGPVPVFRVG